MGNRTPDSAVRGLRLNLLTNTPYSLFIYAVQHKIYYTEELPSCPVLFLFFSKLFLEVNCESNFTELNAFEPRTGRFGKSGTVGRFAPRSPLSLMSSFRGASSSHNFRPESAISLAARPVCSPFLAKPYSFVSGSKFFTQLPAGKHGFAPIGLLPAPR